MHPYISHDIFALELTFMIRHLVFSLIPNLLVEKDPCLIHYCNHHIPSTAEVTANLYLFKKKKKDEQMNTFYSFSTAEQIPEPLSSSLVLQKWRFDQPVYPVNVRNVDRQIG